MSVNRIKAFFERNVVLITGVSLIIATHWGWSRIQDNPRLVPEDKKRELPVIIGLKYLRKIAMEKFNAFTTGPRTHNAEEKK